MSHRCTSWVVVIELDRFEEKGVGKEKRLKRGNIGRPDIQLPAVLLVIERGTPAQVDAFSHELAPRDRVIYHFRLRRRSELQHELT